MSNCTKQSFVGTGTVGVQTSDWATGGGRACPLLPHPSEPHCLVISIQYIAAVLVC